MNSVLFHKFERMDLYNTANLTKNERTQQPAREGIGVVRPGLTRFKDRTASG